MAKSGPIVFIEDDLDDQEFVREVISRLDVKNELIFFTRAMDAFDFLKSSNVQPLIIFSDVNLPLMNGLEFKLMLDADLELRARSIPFVFFSTSVDKLSVEQAFKHMTVQGFFQKSAGLNELQKTIGTILDYWLISKHPNNM